MTGNENRRPAVVRTDAEPAPETDWNAVYEAQKADDGKPEGGILNNGFAKIGCGCLLPAIVMLSTCAGTSSASGAGGPYLTGYVAGGIIAGMLLCWAPLFAFWLRDQGKWIIGISFILFAAIFGIITLSKVGQERQKLMNDMSAVGDVQIDKDGNAVIGEGAASKGPFGKMMVQMMAERDKIYNDYEKTRTDMGLDVLFIANELKKNPKILDNCNLIPTLENNIEEARTKTQALLKGLRDKINAMDYSPSVKADMIRGLGNEQSDNYIMVDKQWGIQQRGIEPTFRACKMLAKRQWTSDGQTFVFQSNDDTAVYNQSITKLNALDIEAGELLKKQTDKLQTNKKNVSDLLDTMKK
jgi:hypothetical protein